MGLIPISAGMGMENTGNICFSSATKTVSSIESISFSSSQTIMSRFFWNELYVRLPVLIQYSSSMIQYFACVKLYFRLSANTTVIPAFFRVSYVSSLILGVPYTFPSSMTRVSTPRSCARMIAARVSRSVHVYISTQRRSRARSKACTKASLSGSEGSIMRSADHELTIYHHVSYTAWVEA